MKSIEGKLIKVWEAYKENSQECLCARTKGLAKRLGYQVFGTIDVVSKVSVYMTKEEQEKIANDSFILFK